eukprot:6178457-Pleurochrysis_carterae.AAC.3
MLRAEKAKPTALPPLLLGVHVGLVRAVRAVTWEGDILTRSVVVLSNMPRDDAAASLVIHLFFEQDKWLEAAKAAARELGDVLQMRSARTRRAQARAWLRLAIRVATDPSATPEGRTLPLQELQYTIGKLWLGGEGSEIREMQEELADIVASANEPQTPRSSRSAAWIKRPCLPRCTSDPSPRDLPTASVLLIAFMHHSHDNA